MSLLHRLLPEVVPFTKVDCSLQSCVVEVQPQYHRCWGWADADCPPLGCSAALGWWRQGCSWAGRMGQINLPELRAVRVKETVPVPFLCSWGQGCTLGGAADVCLSVLAVTAGTELRSPCQGHRGVRGLGLLLPPPSLLGSAGAPGLLRRWVRLPGFLLRLVPEPRSRLGLCV